MHDWLPIFNLITITLFVFAVVLGLARMVRRLIELLMTGQKIPRLLKRDLLLFTSFAIAFGVGGILGRVFNIPLQQQPLWVVPISLLALLSIFYWVRVEYTLEDELPADPDLPDAADAEGVGDVPVQVDGLLAGPASAALTPVDEPDPDAGDVDHAPAPAGP